MNFKIMNKKLSSKLWFSKTKMAVTILVVLAGNIFLFSFLLYKILFVLLSTNKAEEALISNADVKSSAKT